METRSIYAVGIDVGGTKIAGGLVKVSASRTDVRPLAHQVIATHAEQGGRAVLTDVVRLGGQLAANVPDDEAVTAVGVGLCELVDRQGNVGSAHCIDWLNLNVGDELSRIAPSARVLVEADVRAAARAESVLGAGRDFDVFLYVTIGTGISCCLMVNGQPWLGAQGATGTMASSPLWIPDSGKSGPTLEELASGPALITRFNTAGGAASTGHYVLQAVRAEDPAATEVVR